MAQMVVIHKSWCGACKRLGPDFAATKEVTELSSEFVMIVRHDTRHLSFSRVLSFSRLFSTSSFLITKCARVRMSTTMTSRAMGSTSLTAATCLASSSSPRCASYRPRVLCVCVCAWPPMLWICCRNDHVLPHLHMFPQEGELLPEYNSGNPKYQYHSGREAIARIVFVQTVRHGI